MPYILTIKVKYWLTSSGRSPVEEFLDKCPEDIQKDYFDAVMLLARGITIPMPLNRHLHSIQLGVNELRFKDRAGQYRFIYYIKKRDGIYFLHAFNKKTRELPLKEKKLIIKRLKEV